MMKLLAVALVVLVCISVAVVNGRKNKRGKDRLQHLEKRREFPRNRVKGKPNVVEPSNDAVANKVGNNVKKLHESVVLNRWNVSSKRDL